MCNTIESQKFFIFTDNFCFLFSFFLSFSFVLYIVVHGDFHHWNTMFRKEDADPSLEPCISLDMQCWGPGRPSYDISYFMMLS